MVNSNGPIYDQEILLKTLVMQTDAYSYCYLMVKIANGTFKIPDRSRDLLFNCNYRLNDPNIGKVEPIIIEAYKYLHPNLYT